MFRNAAGLLQHQHKVVASFNNQSHIDIANVLQQTFNSGASENKVGTKNGHLIDMSLFLLKTIIMWGFMTLILRPIMSYLFSASPKETLFFLTSQLYFLPFINQTNHHEYKHYTTLQAQHSSTNDPPVAGRLLMFLFSSKLLWFVL